MELSDFSEDAEIHVEFRRVIWEHRAVFNGLGLFKGTTHVIDVKPDAKPMVMPSRRLSPAEMKAEEEIVLKIVATGVLEPCVSANVSRNVFVPKKDFGMRCTGDFWG